jgi:hypothetical protein
VHRLRPAAGRIRVPTLIVALAALLSVAARIGRGTPSTARTVGFRIVG